jgi:hypothetical protein
MKSTRHRASSCAPGHPNGVMRATAVPSSVSTIAGPEANALRDESDLQEERRFGGHAVYVKDNRLHYVNSFVGSLEQAIVSDEELPTGENLILSAAFEKKGEDPPGVSVGTLSLFHGDVKVGEEHIRTQPGKFALGGDGFASDATAATR